ncbi:hypothetical protein L873DRAFT_1793091 [Choiromyces venosus 120613-1]|uniref:Uncharacterized protein n=1 Tax=Choiromyces venosus 120613-1 TaxID=1336337 RepID=A0A3N4JA90_9PEZI|nr:hypothetical protein L873DRAFT_1793091 [Choiromyces venosus 120613-1]
MVASAQSGSQPGASEDQFALDTQVQVSQVGNRHGDENIILGMHAGPSTSHGANHVHLTEQNYDGSDCTKVIPPTTEGGSHNGLGSGNLSGTPSIHDSQEQTDKAVQKVQYMYKKTWHEDYQKKDQEISSQLIDALTEMGEKVLEALGKLGPSEGTSADIKPFDWVRVIDKL